MFNCCRHVRLGPRLPKRPAGTTRTTRTTRGHGAHERSLHSYCQSSKPWASMIHMALYTPHSTDFLRYDTLKPSPHAERSTTSSSRGRGVGVSQWTDSERQPKQVNSWLTSQEREACESECEGLSTVADSHRHGTSRTSRKVKCSRPTRLSESHICTSTRPTGLMYSHKGQIAD